MPKTVVAVATFNERDNIPSLVEEILAQLPESLVLVIDDNSPDGTGLWCQEQAAVEHRLHCIRREGKLGLGTAVIAAMQYAIEHDFDYLVSMDADFSHPPRYLPDLVGGMESNHGAVDVMVGSRYASGGGIDGWPLKRRVMSKAVNLFARWMLWIPASDCSGAYRCYRVSLLRKIDFTQVRSKGYSFFEEILWHLRRANARFGELPYTFVDREKGESKVNSKEAVSAIARMGMLGAKTWLWRM